MRTLLVGLLLVLGGCGSKEPAAPPPTLVLLELQASADLNQSPAGTATPVRVWLYELKSGAAAFNRADYFALVEAAQTTLAADLVAQDELLIQPGQQQRVERTLDEATRLLGIVVGYRDLDSARWRLLLEVPSGQTSHYAISLGARAVSAEAKPVPEKEQ